MSGLYLANDPDTATGGSTYDDLSDPGPVAFPGSIARTPPLTSSQVTAGENRTNRNTEGRGRRGNSVSRPWDARPSVTASHMAYPKITNWMIARALGAAGTPTGSAPAPVESPYTPLQSGNLASFCAKLVRDEQTDDLYGCWANTWTLTLPNEGEGTFEWDAMAKYHEVTTTASEPARDNAGYVDTYEIRTAEVFDGPTGTDLIDCVSSATIAFSNALKEDVRRRFCAGKNVVQRTLDGSVYRVWYPTWNALGPQTMNITLDFGSPQPTRELDRIFAAADKLVIEARAGDAGTTPASDDMIRIEAGQAVVTEGGTDPFNRDGDHYSSYQYETGVDDTGADTTITFSGAAAVTLT